MISIERVSLGILQPEVAGVERLCVIGLLNQLSDQPRQFGFADQDLFDEQPYGVPRLLILGVTHFAKNHGAFKLKAHKRADGDGFGEGEPHTAMGDVEDTPAGLQSEISKPSDLNRNESGGQSSLGAPVHTSRIVPSVSRL